MSFTDWLLLAQAGLLALVPAIGWIGTRVGQLRRHVADLESRVKAFEEHDIGDVKDTLHGRVTEVATGLAGVKGALDQLNHTYALMLEALIKKGTEA